MDDETRGERIQTRLTSLGISDREFHEQTGIDRKTLRRAVCDGDRVRASTYAAIENALDKLEAQVNPAVLTPVAESGLVEFVVEGRDGVRAVVKGQIDDLPALEAAVTRLISSLRPIGETGN